MHFREILEIFWIIFGVVGEARQPLLETATKRFPT
jgi:hypothetical protein